MDRICQSEVSQTRQLVAKMAEHLKPNCRPAPRRLCIAVRHAAESPLAVRADLRQNLAVELHQADSSITPPSANEESSMRHGARNDITGKVIQIIPGDGVMGLAKVKVSGEFEMSSVMTSESLKALKLKKGDQVRVIVKAVNVLLVKDD
jgi:molybdopterin-binding protein